MSNINYYITIDSQYRNRNQYALPTDFGVSFQTTDKNGIYPQGEPLDPTQFFPRATIDKNFDSSKLYVVNGPVCEVLYNNSAKQYIYVGYACLSQQQNQLIVRYDDEMILVIPPEKLSWQKGYEFDWTFFPYILAFSLTGKFQWIVYSTEATNQTYQGKNYTQCFTLDQYKTNLYYIGFLFQTNLSFTHVDSSGVYTPLNYDLINPYGDGHSALAMISFTSSGLPNSNYKQYVFHTIANPEGTSSPFNMTASSEPGFWGNPFYQAVAAITSTLNSTTENLIMGCQIDNQCNNTPAADSSVNPNKSSPSNRNLYICVLDAPPNALNTSNSPVYYPTTVGIESWQPLAFTTSIYDTTGLSDIALFYFSGTYFCKSQSLIICNTTTDDSSYTGTSIVAPLLYQRELPTYTTMGNIDNTLYDRQFIYSTGTYTSGASTNVNTVFYTYIDQIYTASFYSTTSSLTTEGYIVCDNTPFSSTVATITTFYFELGNPDVGNLNLTQESTYIIPPTTSTTKIESISTVYKSATEFYIFVVWNDGVNTYLHLLTYDTIAVTYAVTSTLTLAHDAKYGGCFYCTSDNLSIFWETSDSDTDPITFYYNNAGTLTSMGTITITDIGIGMRSGLRAYMLENPENYYFTASIAGTQNTWKLVIDGGLYTVTYTLQTTIANNSINSYTWLDSETWREYLLTSNLAGPSTQIYNNITNQFIGTASNLITKPNNNIYFVTNDTVTRGDIYAVGQSPNALYGTWGSILQNPIFNMSVIELNSNYINQITLPKTIQNAVTFEYNNVIYVIFSYYISSETNEYFYIYNISEIQNILYVGSITANSVFLPSVRLDVAFQDGYVFLLCESTITKVIRFTMDNVSIYTVIDVNLSNLYPLYSKLLNNFSVNYPTDLNLYLFQTYSDSTNIYIIKYIYNPLTISFDVVNTVIESSIATPLIYGVAKFTKLLLNSQILYIWATDGTVLDVYKIIKMSLDMTITEIEVTDKSSVPYNLFTLAQQGQAVENYSCYAYNYYNPFTLLMYVYTVDVGLNLESYSVLLDSSVDKPYYTFSQNSSGDFVDNNSNITGLNILRVNKTLTIDSYRRGAILFQQFQKSDYLQSKNGTSYPTINLMMDFADHETPYNYFITNSTNDLTNESLVVINRYYWNSDTPSIGNTITTYPQQIYGKGCSALVILNLLTSSVNITRFGDRHPSTGHYNTSEALSCWINGLTLDYQLKIVCTSLFTNQIAIYNYGQNFDTNFYKIDSSITTINKNNGCVVYFDNNILANFLVPIVSSPTLISPRNVIGSLIKLKDRIVCTSLFGGFGSFLAVYEKQLSRVSSLIPIVIPMTVQQYINSVSSYQSGAFLICLDKSGLFIWSTYVRALNIASGIAADLGIGFPDSLDDYVSVKTAFQGGPGAIFSNKDGDYYTYINTTGNNNNYVFFHTIDYDGQFIQASSYTSNPVVYNIDIPYAWNYPDYYKGGNLYINQYMNETILPITEVYYPYPLESLLTLVQNKDTTIGGMYKSYFPPTTTTKHIFTGSGVYELDIPTGCINIEVKVWGAGGSCPSDSLTNNWTAYGGGGGYAFYTSSVFNYDKLYIEVGQAGQGSQCILTGTLQYTGGNGGGASSCWVYQNNFWTPLAVAGGGGGAGAGATGPSSSTGSYGGKANSIGFRGITNVYPYETQYGFNGYVGVGGDGGNIAGSNDSQNGQNYIYSYSGTFLELQGTGGTASFNNTGSAYTFLYGGGAGGAGYGGGGAGDPGIDPLGGNIIQSCGGGGGGIFTSSYINNSNDTESWYPLNNLDPDFQLLNPDAGVGVYNYGQGGSPILDGLGNYNPTGTNGVVIVRFDFQSYTSTHNNSLITAGSVLKYKTRKLPESNLKYYSELTVYKDSTNPNLDSSEMFFPYQTGAVTGALQGYSVYLYASGPDASYVNHTYLIKDNYYQNGEYKILLDRYIDTNLLNYLSFHKINDARYSLYFFTASISKTPITSIISYTGTSSEITMLSTSSPIDSSNSYYILYNNSGTIGVSTITNISTDPDTEITTISLTGGNLEGHGPYIYVVPYNYSVLYNLQFYPQSIYRPVYYNVTLLSLAIPNRSILTSYIGGTRYLSDFPYIFLQVWNAGEDGLPDPQVINNIYTNNLNGPPNGVLPPVFPNESIFKINTQGAGPSEDNFIYYSSPVVARVKFIPNYNNIRCRLLDTRGNVIKFDNTPVKASDIIFGSGVVPDELLRVVVDFSFVKIQ
jgi:hypothetical protein